MHGFLSFATVWVLGSMASAMDWERLPSLPDDHGYAGSFAGVSHESLIVAGGTNFPREKPWEGGQKVWYDGIYALDSPEGKWQRVGRLPCPNGYGVSVTTSSGFVLIGGGDAKQHFDSVFRLELHHGQIVTEALPALPQPCAFMAGAVDADHIYLTGGIRHPADTQAMPYTWMLDRKAPSRGWQVLPACPGKPRILAQMAVLDGVLYLFGGAALHPGKDGKAVREWLQDSWRFSDREGWSPLAKAPHAIVAAPSPLLTTSGKIWIFGGDDGQRVDFEPKSKHPGFPQRTLSYDFIRNQWMSESSLPFSLVTTPLVPWRGRWVVPGGESRPGMRSTDVWWCQRP